MWVFQNITLHRATKIRLAFHFVERNKFENGEQRLLVWDIKMWLDGENAKRSGKSKLGKDGSKKKLLYMSHLIHSKFMFRVSFLLIMASMEIQFL